MLMIIGCVLTILGYIGVNYSESDIINYSSFVIVVIGISLMIIYPWVL